MLSHRRWSNGNAAGSRFSVGGSNPGLLTFSGSSGDKAGRPGFEPPTWPVRSAALPLAHKVACSHMSPHCLGTHLPLTKNQTVCFCLTDCWPGAGTEWLTVNLSSRCTAEGNRIICVLNWIMELLKQTFASGV